MLWWWLACAAIPETVTERCLDTRDVISHPTSGESEDLTEAFTTPLTAQDLSESSVLQIGQLYGVRG